MKKNEHHVFLRGGLGNQFFQWIYAQSLYESGTPVKLNVTFLKLRKNNQTSGKLELLHVISSIDIPIVEWHMMRRYEFLIKRVAKFLGILSDDRSSKKFPWSFMHYGYYQSSEYLSNYSIKKAKNLINIDIKSGKFISDLGAHSVLHIRAGDYLSNEFNFKNMGLLSTEYHVLAARKMLEKYKNNKLIVVTDNESIASLVIERLNDYDGRVFLLSEILGRSETQIDAIKTMVSAQAISLSNSSFSAMCAILGSADEVIYPSPWFRAQELQHISPVLKEWTGIESIFCNDQTRPCIERV
ncbi:alpha-1,2-fucosyltransferase [Comamonas terrigena]|uniref:alpha-1,2-fucosyltransferase n=1 Tax=Comamonas terrigena TaxID=32013 RepID=UPI00289D38D6|nr:alpha-1,2-fucosyltransferase [Comamonas terrigena]